MEFTKIELDMIEDALNEIVHSDSWGTSYTKEQQEAIISAHEKIIDEQCCRKS